MKLIFVYNSDSSVISLIKDTVHKIVSPGTYACNLCRITYSGVKMQKEWRKFIGSLPYEVMFLHRDEFRSEYPELKDVQLPAAFVKDVGEPALLIPSAEINKAKRVEELMDTVRNFMPK